jgi:hypothetical protein
VNRNARGRISKRCWKQMFESSLRIPYRVSS